MPETIKEAVFGLLRPYVPQQDVEKWLDRLESGLEEVRAESYLTRREVAERLRLSIVSVDRLLASGDLPYCKIRRSVRISESALRSFIDGSAS